MFEGIMMRDQDTDSDSLSRGHVSDLGLVWG